MHYSFSGLELDTSVTQIPKYLRLKGITNQFSLKYTVVKCQYNNTNLIYKNVNVITVLFLVSGDLTGLCLYMNVPTTYLIARNVHGPCFTSPLFGEVKNVFEINNI